MPAIPSDRSTKESYIATLLMLAEADDRDHENEMRFIASVAIRLGLSEEDVKTIDQHPENLIFNNEIQLCHELGTRLGFNYLMVDELIEVMRKNVGQRVSGNALLDIIKKYMN